MNCAASAGSLLLKVTDLYEERVGYPSKAVARHDSP